MTLIPSSRPPKNRQPDPIQTLDVIITSLNVAARIFEELKPIVAMTTRRKGRRAR